MSTLFPDYLTISAAELGRGTPVKVRVLSDMASIARDVADAPGDQFPILAKMINDERTDCRDVVLINMDEYLTNEDEFVSADHPLSFRGYMERAFYSLIDPALAPRPENRVFPDPSDCGAIQRSIESRGGLGACFGGGSG